MKGFWYIPALASLCSVLVKIFDTIFIYIALLLWFVYLYKTKRLGKLMIVFSLACFLFFIFYIPEINHSYPTQDPQKTTIKGTIVSPVVSSEKLLQMTIRDETTQNLIQVTYFNPKTEDRLADIKHGAICVIDGELGSPERSRNPGQFNYQFYLASKGIQLELEISNPESISCSGESFISHLYSFRNRMLDYVSEHYPERSSAWINALVLGDDGDIPKEIEALFQRWGLSHLLAISGLHIGLVVGLFYFITIKWNILTREKAQWVMVFFLPVYAILAGGEPSVWRASLMVFLVIILQKIKQRYSVTDIISIIFLMLLLTNSYIIYQIGFQFSFLVTFGIILSRKWLSKNNSRFFQLFKLSFISQLIIIPLQLQYFYNVNPLSIVLNIFVVPYFSFFVIPLMFLLLILSPIPFVSTIIESIFHVFYHWGFLMPMQYMDQIAYNPFVTGYFPEIMKVIYYCFLFIFMNKLVQDQLRHAFYVGILLTAILIWVVAKPYFSPYGMVTMLDIGQGDAFVIELPFRKGVILVDAGAGLSYESMTPNDNVFSDIIEPFLTYRGITDIDAIFVSHEDIDHSGSVRFIVEKYNVSNVIVSPFYPLELETIEAIEKQGTRIVRVQQGDKLTIKENTFTIRSPGVDSKSSNENSLVFDVRLGNQNWLFTGDIGTETELDLRRNYPNLEVDTLKIAHHGSDSSTDKHFLNQINPKVALISVGQENRYGHPSNDVIQLLKQKGVNILRTDLHGAVLYQFTGNEGTFYKFIP
ncbi:DNA internalization-related competence protein ComEC/Rec2 [Ornithinibacillus xuwenensis]|uniref:DNA internalization-related competence protein ComEC/Rec2 n=1 Tax=Ornithinibacillus xuwenensis TaxID=3144668 RepID=A0ABU9XCE4_9BACI